MCRAIAIYCNKALTLFNNTYVIIILKIYIIFYSIIIVVKCFITKNDNQYPCYFCFRCFEEEEEGLGLLIIFFLPNKRDPTID